MKPESAGSGTGSGRDGDGVDATVLAVVALLAAVGLVVLGYRRLARAHKRQKDEKNKAITDPDIRAVPHEGEQRLTSRPARAPRIGLVVHPDNEGGQSVRLHESWEREEKENE